MSVDVDANDKRGLSCDVEEGLSYSFRVMIAIKQDNYTKMIVVARSGE